MARPRRIDRDAVLAASLAIADDVGIDRLTMHAVAKRLDVTTMALYRHVDDKADLLDGVVERLLDEIPVPDADLPPQEQLAVMGRDVRAVARRHPTVFPLLLQLPATTPVARRSRDRVIELLTGLGVAQDRARQAERLISTIVLGFAASEAASRFGRHTRQEIDDDYAVLEAAIRRLIADYVDGA